MGNKFTNRQVEWGVTKKFCTARMQGAEWRASLWSRETRNHISDKGSRGNLPSFFSDPAEPETYTAHAWPQRQCQKRQSTHACMLMATARRERMCAQCSRCPQYLRSTDWVAFCLQGQVVTGQAMTYKLLQHSPLLNVLLPVASEIQSTDVQTTLGMLLSSKLKAAPESPLSVVVAIPS